MVVLLVLGCLPALLLPALASATPLHGTDLGISLTASPPTVVGGSNVAFTATVTNDGYHDADDVVVTDQLPPGATFVADASDPSCSQSEPSDPVVCALDGEIEEGASVDVVITATIPCTSETLVDSASVSADDPDPNPSNNSAETSVTVETPCSGASGEVENGGTVTTDPEHQGTQPDLGIYETASITVPQGVSGEVSIQLSSDSDCPDFTTLLATTNQPATTDRRLVLVFTYAACAVPAGTNIHDTTIFKSVDGQTYVGLAPCVSRVAPDPCVGFAKVLANGDFRYWVLWSGQGDPSWRPG
jgi:uncharacterized repeat protein (TIGR01451 family)